MKSINVEVFHWVFMALFLGLVPVTLATAAVAATAMRGPWSRWLYACAATYCVGCFLVTGAGNVPMNNELADLQGHAQSSYWTGTYVPRWTLLNTIRTVACVAASGCALVAYGLLAAGGGSGGALYSPV
mmetsp:Transcript_3977/g.15834  ORF Transcript_3977/g.15834 Transcript_3977/m.15834 type:complete len:129 (-) Transcript_3977:1323-1709(-)